MKKGAEPKKLKPSSGLPGPSLGALAVATPAVRMASAPDTFHKHHLWMYLQAMGFDPALDAKIRGKTHLHVHLGVNMFDKPNLDGFHIVSYFLFKKLDESRAKEVFKNCWPPFDQKRANEFRKRCCELFKDISAERGSSFPQVFSSQLVSPGGLNVIDLMYHLARYVAIKYLQTKSENSSPHFAETFNRKPRDMHICIARCHVARNRFFQILQREHYVTQKYQENAQLSVQQLRFLRSRIMELQDQIKKVEPCDDSSNIQGKIQKVQSLWTSMNETLIFLEKEREVVTSVLSVVDQYALDGTNVVINVPRLLVERIEKQICELQIGNIHEAGKLNLLTVIQLLNEVLKVMKYEHCKADQPRLTTDLHTLEKELRLQRESLSHMENMRHKIEENTIAIRDSVSEKEEEWHSKWKEYLGLSPFSLIKDWTAAVDLLPPMPPLSFDPASEEAYEKSILSQYPASLPDTHNENIQEDVCRTGDLSALATSSASFPVDHPSSSDRNSVNLLEKFARVVLSDSPLLSEDKEEELEEHLEELNDTLISNPFLPRKEIPRTPAKAGLTTSGCGRTDLHKGMDSTTPAGRASTGHESSETWNERDKRHTQRDDNSFL